MNIYTIGHSNLSQDQFITILKKHEIQAIADVRSHPYSRYLPHFNKQRVKQILEEENIEYVYLGKELGGRSNNPDCYLNGQVLYAKIAETADFEEGIALLLNLAKSDRTALMCAEKDPINCHRAILICQHLKNYDLEILHILNQGDLETQEEFETRLIHHTRLINNQLQLFDSDLTSLLPQAYQIQGKKIAYKKKD